MNEGSLMITFQPHKGMPNFWRAIISNPAVRKAWFKKICQILQKKFIKWKKKFKPKLGRYRFLYRWDGPSGRRFVKNSSIFIYYRCSVYLIFKSSRNILQILQNLIIVIYWKYPDFFNLIRSNEDGSETFILV